MWHDIRQAFDWVDATPEARVAVLQAEGKYFTAGIDLQMMMGLGQEIADDCEARMREKLRRLILDLQDTLTSLERCRKPVLAAIHGGCIGGGIDLITCADMRYCSSDAFFTIKEIDIGMVADVGTLQRLPKLVGQGITRELAYTGRKFDAAEAKDIGLVNRVFDNREALYAGVHALAADIASQVAPVHPRHQGNAEPRPRPQRGRQPELHRHLERRHAAKRRPDGGHDRQHGKAGAGVQGLKASKGTSFTEPTNPLKTSFTLSQLGSFFMLAIHR
jgi:enoyl-CoA hydratase/carnithine racemase